MRSALCEEFHAYYCNSGQKPKTGKVTGLSIKPDIVILLNGHAVKLPPKYLCLYTETWLLQKSFFLHWTPVNGKMYI